MTGLRDGSDGLFSFPRRLILGERFPQRNLTQNPRSIQQNSQPGYQSSLIPPILTYPKGVSYFSPGLPEATLGIHPKRFPNPNRGCVYRGKSLGLRHASIVIPSSYSHGVFHQRSQAFLKDSSFRDELHSYLGGCTRSHGSTSSILPSLAGTSAATCRTFKSETNSSLIPAKHPVTKLRIKRIESAFISWQNVKGLPRR